ncbi:hypothetical protein F5Y15DRAFT_5884 [Xylariaceae sp. FL0016]|nr:hypothetical protein F5Y15DRAFT_5884 [Xylariaceae sp. FL0016]
MSGPRVTIQASKLARSISTTAPAAVPQSTARLATAPLSRKYEDLLTERNIDPDHPRHLTTRSANRPHPQPRKMRLMQTFSSSASVPGVTSVDNIIFPGNASLRASENDPFSQLRVPLLPDNSVTHYSVETAEEPLAAPEISIVAANPDIVSPAPLTEIEGMGMDGAELKFIHDGEAADQQQGMLSNIWKGLDNVLGGQTKANLAI